MPNLPEYPVTLRYSREDAAYIASVPDLPGCASDGHTPAEAHQNAMDAAAEWVRTARSLGRYIPAPSGGDYGQLLTRKAV